MKCNVNNCPGEIFFTTSLDKEGKKRTRVINYFCPICGWTRLFKIEITKQEYKKAQKEESKLYKA